MAWAAEEGILTGVHGPASRVTRQELIAALYRYETGYLGRAVQSNGSLARFTDGLQVQAANQAAMRWAVGVGLMNGTSATTLSPNNYATQLQLDTVLQRYNNLS